MAFSFGVVTRDEAIAAMEAAPPWARFELSDPRVVALTGILHMVVVKKRWFPKFRVQWLHK